MLDECQPRPDQRAADSQGGVPGRHVFVSAVGIHRAVAMTESFKFCTSFTLDNRCVSHDRSHPKVLLFK